MHAQHDRGRVARAHHAAHRHPGHRFDAARDDQVFPARTDFGGGEIHGFKARSAVTIELHARDTPVPSGGKRRRLRNATRLIAPGLNAADQDIIDAGGVELVS